MSVYLIKPLEKKSIVWHVEMYRHNKDGSISWFNLDETFRWGQGFIEEDMDCNLPYEDSRVAYAKSEPGWGCEFDDSINIEIEYSDDITEEEQEAIREAYYEGGAGWLFDGEHDWQEEDTSVLVYAPFQISLCEDDGTIIEENVKLEKRPTSAEIKASMAAWPFSKGNESL
jgi:hypothetical protein